MDAAHVPPCPADVVGLKWTYGGVKEYPVKMGSGAAKFFYSNSTATNRDPFKGIGPHYNQELFVWCSISIQDPYLAAKKK